MHALNAIVEQGHQVGIAVEQGQELEAFHGMLGSAGNGDHSALGSGGVHVRLGAGDEGNLNAALLGGGVLIAQRVALRADKIFAGKLGAGAHVVGGIGHGQGGVHITGLVVLTHLFHKGFVFLGGKLVEQLVAVGAFGAYVVGVEVQAHQVYLAGVARNDDGVGHHALKHHGLHQEGVEAVALNLLGLGKQIAEGEEVQLFNILKGIAELIQQGYVHVPAVLGSEVLVAVHGVNALAVRAIDGGGLHQRLGDSGGQIRAVLSDQIVQLEPEAALGVGIVLIRAPGAGEVHVNGRIAGVDGVGGLVVKVAPGAPDDFQLRANLVGDVLVHSLEHGGIIGYIAAMEHDGNGGQLVSHGKGSHGDQHRQRKNQSQDLFHEDSSFKFM